MDAAPPPSPDPRRRRRRWWWIALAAGLLVVGITYALTSEGGSDAMRPPRAFCVAAYRYERELDRQIGRGERDIDRQIELVTAMDAAAPPAIRAETHAFLRAMEQVETNPSIRDRPSVQAAVDAVNRYATQGCRLLDQSPQP